MAASRKQEVEIPAHWAGERLDKVAADLFGPLSRARLKNLIAQGALSLNDEITTRPKTKVQAGQLLTLQEPKIQDSSLQPQNIPISILYEDAHLLVLNKPASLVVHPGAGNSSGTLVNALLFHCGDSLRGIGGERRPGLVHRLDKDTSGLMVVAKDTETLNGLQAQFRARTIQRHYLALVWGLVASADGTIDAPLGRHPRDRLRMTVRQDGREAVTNFRLMEAYGTFACQVACRLQTGRTHQIRVHFSYYGYPLLGDPLYGAPGKRLLADAPAAARAALALLPGQALHAGELGFWHPMTNVPLHFETPPPPAFSALVDGLKQA